MVQRRRRRPRPRGREWFSLALFLILVALSARSPAAASSAATISGSVCRDDGICLGGVQVKLAGMKRRTVTDNDGNFVFRSVPTGSYTLVLSLGDRNLSRSGVEVVDGEVTRIDQTVDWEPLPMQTITVRAVSRRRERVSSAPAAVSVITAPELRREEAATNPARLLDIEPGVEIVQGGADWHVINARGFNTALNRRLRVFIDGRDICAPLIRLPDWGTAPMVFEDLADVELVRGPTSALYGADAFNGIIAFNTRAPQDSHGGVVRLSTGERATRRVDLRHAMPLGNDWHMKFTATYREVENFSVSRTSGVEYSRPCSFLGEKDCLPLESTPLPTAFGETRGYTLRFDKLFASGPQLLVEAGHGGYDGGGAGVVPTGRWYSDSSDRSWIRVGVADERWNVHAYYTERDHSGLTLSSGIRSYDNSSWTVVDAHFNSGFAGGRGHLVAGATARFETIDTAGPDGAQTLIIDPLDEELYSLFAQADVQLTEPLRLIASLRWDHASYYDAQVSPRASLVYDVSPAHNLRFSYSEGFKAPNYAEIYVWAELTDPVDLAPFEAFCAPFDVSCGFDTPTEIRAVPNESLRVETIRSYELGYRGLLGRSAYVTVDLYHSEIDDLLSNLIPMINSRLGWISPTFQPYQPPPDLPAPAAAGLLAALAANLPPELFAVLSNHHDGRPLFAAYSGTNFGRAEATGAEVGLGFRFDRRWTLDLSYTYFDGDVVEQLAEDPLLPNTATNRYGAALSFREARWNGTLQYRHVDSFPWRTGIFWGQVPAFDVVTVSVGFEPTRHWRVGIDVENLLDDVHYEQFGGDLLRRRAVVYVSRGW